jgi:hypothetical protein
VSLIRAEASIPEEAGLAVTPRADAAATGLRG